jgi:hypothetical protein
VYFRPRERQVEFPPLQRHVSWLTPVMLLLSAVCIVVVIIVLLVHPHGAFIGPWG